MTRQSRWRDFSDFKLLRIFMAGRRLVISYKRVSEKVRKPAAPLERGTGEVKAGAEAMPPIFVENLLQLPFPGEGVADNRLKVITARRPIERRANPRCGGNQLWRVPSAPLRHHPLDFGVGRPIDAVKNVEHRIAASVAAI